MKALTLSRSEKRSATSLVASATGAVMLFLTFRLTISLTSVEIMGAWALLQGLFIVSRVADSGMGANITRYVSVNLAESREVSGRAVAGAGVLIGLVPVVLICGITFAPIVWYVKGLFRGSHAATEVVPLAILCVAFAATSSLATTLLAICEGAGRLVAKNGVIIASNCLGIVVAYPSLRHFGAPGVGITYCAVSISQLALATVLLHRDRSLRGPRGERVGHISRHLWRENAQLSGVAALRLTFEPLTKFLLSRVTTLAGVAAFELALRVTTQIRVLLQSSAQPLLLMGARKTAAPTAEVAASFSRARGILYVVVKSALWVQIAATTVLSYVGLGRLDPHFEIFYVVLVVANAINSLGLTGYFLQLSSGILVPLLRVHAVMAIMNLTLGVIAAALLGQYGVVCAYAITMSYGGLALAAMHARLRTPPNVVSTFRWQTVRGDALGLGLAIVVIASGAFGQLARAIATSCVATVILSGLAVRSVLIATSRKARVSA